MQATFLARSSTPGLMGSKYQLHELKLGSLEQLTKQFRQITVGMLPSVLWQYASASMVCNKTDRPMLEQSRNGSTRQADLILDLARFSSVAQPSHPLAC